MFEPDEFIFTKFAHYFKRRNRRKHEKLEHVVALQDIKSRLTILARALTGQAIEIYAAEREGGYKDDNFFLPSEFHGFPQTTDNLKFYLFRILYLSIQQQLALNWTDQAEQSLSDSQSKAEETAPEVLDRLSQDYPGMMPFHEELKQLYILNSKKGKSPDFTYIYGKYMCNSKKESEGNPLNNISDLVKRIEEEQAKTIIKANAVEEMKSHQVGKKQLEDNLLLHQCEKVETAEEFGGNWKDLDGDDELDNHSNALDNLNMKHMVRVDDPTHSIYQAEFSENTTVSHSAEQENKDYHLLYDEWDYK